MRWAKASLCALLLVLAGLVVAAAPGPPQAGGVSGGPPRAGPAAEPSAASPVVGVADAVSLPVVSASAGAVMDGATGIVLFDKAMHQRRPMASTTKIMTALVALESADLDAYVVVGPDAMKVQSPGLDLTPGERVSLNDLLAALLLRSSNAAAIAIADHVAGSVGAFAARMNERARSLGARDTHFVNPHGLHAPDHYSSAYDLALITREAMKYGRFRELVAQRVAEIGRPDANTRELIENHNKLLWRADYIDGVKTGYVRESGQCLVASATKRGWQLIAVVLDSADKNGEALGLLEWGFSSYRQQVFARSGDAVGRAKVRFGRASSVPAVCQQGLTQVTGPGLPEVGQLRVTLRRLKAPVAQGEVAGLAEVSAGGKVIARSLLRAGKSVPRSRLIIAATWMLRVAGLLVIAAVGVRSGAKLVQGRRRRRSSFPPQGRRPYPRGPGAG